MVENTSESATRLAGLAVFAAVITLNPAQASGSSAATIPLGGEFLVCEASAALLVDCPNSDGTCLLVGDNEVRHDLFLYKLDLETKSLAGGKPIAFEHLLPGKKLKHRQLSDIEALVGLPSGEVIIYASHSRNKDCEIKPERRQFLHARLGTNGLEQGSVDPPEILNKDKALRCTDLFHYEPDELPSSLQRVCTEIEETERDADDASDEDECDANPPFNLEGAVAVPDGAGSARVWIGLRAPLVAGKAVLLRQIADRSMLRFDAVAFLELAGDGIRELSFADGQVWVISGPPTDPPKNVEFEHTLWRFPAAGLAGDNLEDGVMARIEEVRKLDPFAEGLAIHNDVAYVLVDGDEPDKYRTFCNTNSTYQAIPLYD